MVEIIEHSDYNAPIDNKNIAWLLYTGIDQEKYIVKAFKYTEGIWVIPNVVGIDASQIKQEEQLWNVYDYDYLKTVEEKTNYLKDLTILFKRISSIELGQEFLEELSYLFPINKESEIYMIKNPSKKIDKNNIIKEVKDAIFITGTYRLNKIECCLNQRIDQASQVFITFNPSILSGYFHHNGSSYCLTDPAIVLLHELIHAFHFLNNTYTKFHIEKAHCSLEEVITVGGVTMNIVPNEIKKLSYEILRTRKNMIRIANKSLQKIKKEQIDCFLKKYNLVYENNEITTNSTLDQSYTNKIIHRFNEISFSKELNFPYRLFYAQYPLGIFFSINLKDSMFYSIEKGLITHTFHYKDKNTPTLHKNSLIPQELLPLKHNQYFHFYSWDTCLHQELKNDLKKYEPQAILSKRSPKDFLEVKTDSSGKEIIYSVAIPENFLPEHKSKSNK